MTIYVDGAATERGSKLDSTHLIIERKDLEYWANMVHRRYHLPQGSSFYRDCEQEACRNIKLIIDGAGKATADQTLAAEKSDHNKTKRLLDEQVGKVSYLQEQLNTAVHALKQAGSALTAKDAELLYLQSAKAPNAGSRYKFLRVDAALINTGACEDWLDKKVAVWANQGYRIHTVTDLGPATGFSVPHNTLLITMEQNKG